MDKLLVTGGKALRGTIAVTGAKNVAMKALLASLLTDDDLQIHNVPLISSVLGTINIIEPLGVSVTTKEHTLYMSGKSIKHYKVPLEMGGLYRTATMVLGPLLARFGKAIVPNPGGCRLGKRPVDWHTTALEKMGAEIEYKDGYFVATTKKLTGAHIVFPKNTHTGTESALLAAVLAKGQTILDNAAAEPEVDDLIALLCQMGAKVERTKPRQIVINGVDTLHGTSYTIMPDRNEVVTFAVAAIATKGDVTVAGTQRAHLVSFLKALDDVGGGWEAVDETSTRFYWKQPLVASHITTGPHPAFMTDWQQPWAVLATAASGVSTIHETVFESRFSYVSEMKKMGAKIEFFDPDVQDPEALYNFNWEDRIEGYHQAIKVYGPIKLHEAVMEMTDIRAGATLLLAALIPKGTSVITEIGHLDRGYERLDERLKKLGADIVRSKETV